MSWRNPRYAYLHAARDAGADAITLSHTAGTTDYKDFLIDDRAGSLFKFAESSTGQTITIDRGSGSLDAIDRLIIPAGHNITGTIDLDADTTSGFTSATVLLSGESVSTALIDETFSSNSEQWLRLTFNGTGQWEIPELIFTSTKTTTRGPEQGWVDMIQHNTLHLPLESGVVASLARGLDRRRIEYVYRDVNDSGDLAVFAALLATCGTSRPFILDPAFDTETPLWMKLIEDSQQQQDPAVPAATDSTKRRITLPMLEHIA